MQMASVSQHRRHGNLTGAIEDRYRDRLAHIEITVNVLDFRRSHHPPACRLQSARPPSVMMLTVSPLRFKP